jgi:hypothetical protein
MRYLVRLSVPRGGGWRAWGTTRDEFGRQLAGQESAAIALHVDSEIRRGRDYVRVVIVAAVDAADVAEALDLVWRAFRKAAGEDLAGWDLASAAAEVRPEAPLGTVRLLRGDNAPWDGDAAAELAEPRRGADDDTKPASANVPAPSRHVNARKLVAAQLPERLRSGYAG